MSEDRLVSAISSTSDKEFEETIRPRLLSEYIGQDNLKENLGIYIQAAKERNESLDHMLLYGPPGLGKTTLAYILANELGSHIRVTSGPSISRAGDLASILSVLEAGDILFIDEIHRLPKSVEEILYPAMEDYELDIVTGGDSGAARSIRFQLPPFTLVGATTRAGDLSAPLRDRFGIVSKLDYYTPEQLADIVRRTSRVFDVEIEEDYSNWEEVKAFIKPANKDKLNEMLLVADSIVTAVNVGKIVIQCLAENYTAVAQINVTELMAVVRYGVSITKAVAKRNNQYAMLIYHAEIVNNGWRQLDDRLTEDELLVLEEMEPLVV